MRVRRCRVLPAREVFFAILRGFLAWSHCTGLVSFTYIYKYKELSGGSCQVYLTRRRSSEIDLSQIDGDQMSIIDCHQSDDLSRLSSVR